MTDQSAVVSVRGLSFKRGNRVIYDGVDLDVLPRKITGIMGPSGTGKTTLLRLIGGQLKPDHGVVSVFGDDVANMNRTALFAARAKMGVLFQSGALFSDMNVFDNVAFPIRAHRQINDTDLKKIVADKLTSVGLAGTEYLMPSELSGGMQRRAALARAIALNPELVMYDEPFAGQDPIVKGVLVRLIQDLKTSLGQTTIIVSHDVPEMLDICDYIYVIAGGKVMGEGTPDSLKASQSPFVQQFLTGASEGPVPFQYNESHQSELSSH